MSAGGGGQMFDHATRQLNAADTATEHLHLHAAVGPRQPDLAFSSGALTDDLRQLKSDET